MAKKLLREANTSYKMFKAWLWLQSIEEQEYKNGYTIHFWANISAKNADKYANANYLPNSIYFESGQNYDDRAHTKIAYLPACQINVTFDEKV